MNGNVKPTNDISEREEWGINPELLTQTVSQSVRRERLDSFSS